MTEHIHSATFLNRKGFPLLQSEFLEPPQYYFHNIYETLTIHSDTNRIIKGPTLRSWLEDNRDGLRLHRHLTEAGQDWLVMNRESDLLYRGARLATSGDHGVRVFALRIEDLVALAWSRVTRSLTTEK